MDSDLHNFNGFLCGDESNNLPPTTQDHMSRKQSVDGKAAQYLISPVSNHLEIKVFNMHSPSPLKQNFQFYDEDQSYSQDLSQMAPLKIQKKCINKILSFGESPGRKTSGCNTPSKLTTMSVSSHNSNGIGFREEKRNTKGLKNLSECVYKIVLNLNVTTYKEVAEQLVLMFNKGQFGNCREDESRWKDEQNIKRRVYDALNVLISANVLKKNGKFVMSDDRALPAEKIKLTKNVVYDPQNLKDELKKKVFTINEKKEKIILLNNKIQILQALMKRNCSSKSLKKKEPRISFPIVGVSFSQEIPTIERSDSNSKVRIPTKNIVQVEGDLDLLTKSGIDKLNEDIEEVIGEPCEEYHSFEILNKKSKSRSVDA